MTSDEGKAAGVRKGNNRTSSNPLKNQTVADETLHQNPPKKTWEGRERLALASEINVRSSLTLHFALITGKSAKNNAR
jgi:hypothetical protein